MNFWASYQQFPLLLGAPVVPKAQIWSSKKCVLDPPAPDNNIANAIMLDTFEERTINMESEYACKCKMF